MTTRTRLIEEAATIEVDGEGFKDRMDRWMDLDDERLEMGEFTMNDLLECLFDHSDPRAWP